MSRRNTGAWRTRHGRGLDLQRHQAAIEIRCDLGHAFSVQARDGAVIKCAVCWQQDGTRTWITVRRGGAR